MYHVKIFFYCTIIWTAEIFKHNTQVILLRLIYATYGQTVGHNASLINVRIVLDGFKCQVLTKQAIARVIK